MIHTKKIHAGDTEQGAGGKGYLAFLGCSSARENPGRSEERRVGQVSIVALQSLLSLVGIPGVVGLIALEGLLGV